MFRSSWYLCLFLTALTVSLQPSAASSDDASPANAVLSALGSLQYPQMARLARVEGDVKVQIRIGSDGSVLSTEVLNGSPMLREAALNSTRSSRFECHRCGKEAVKYVATYTFRLREAIDCDGSRARGPRCLYLWKCGTWRPNHKPRAPEITQQSAHITITVDALCVETIAAH